MKLSSIPIMALVVFGTLPTDADVLELKDGKTLNGKYVGGTAGTIRFETGDGIQVVETSVALALTFDASAKTANPTAAAPAPPPAVAPAASSVTVPAGTTLTVRMVDAVSSKDPQGKRFITRLDEDLKVNGVVVVKEGTKVYGRIQSATQARRLTGQSSLDIRLTDIAVGPSLVPILTGGYTESGARSAGTAARGAAAGAAIGAIADGGEGAGKGAAIGAVASGLKKGEAVSVNAGTALDFTLQQPVSFDVVI